MQWRLKKRWWKLRRPIEMRCVRLAMMWSPVFGNGNVLFFLYRFFILVWFIIQRIGKPSRQMCSVSGRRWTLHWNSLRKCDKMAGEVTKRVGWRYRLPTRDDYLLWPLCWKNWLGDKFLNQEWAIFWNNIAFLLLEVFSWLPSSCTCSFVFTLLLFCRVQGELTGAKVDAQL